MKIYVNRTDYGWQTRAVNGEDRMYINVQFKKGIEPNEQFLKIEIVDGFFSMYKTKAGLPKPKLVIMEYNKISQEEYVPNDEPLIEPNKTDDDELPF